MSRRRAVPKTAEGKSTRSPGLPFTIPSALPTYWTPEQALAVFELLDDLRCPIFGRYQSQLLDEIPRNRHPEIDLYYNTTIDDPAMYRDFAIPACWTPEEAFAVFQLLDDIHEHIWAIYHAGLQDLFRKRYRSDANQSDQIVAIDPDDIPF